MKGQGYFGAKKIDDVIILVFCSFQSLPWPMVLSHRHYDAPYCQLLTSDILRYPRVELINRIHIVGG
jgi:hypothetical protein